MKRVFALLFVALAAYLATGVYFVQPDEQAIVRRFGAVLGSAREPGAHFGLPWSWDRIDRIKPREIKRVTLGPAVVARDAVGATAAQFLTGDRNLVNFRATLQYTIKDPRQYLFHTAEVDRLVALGGEAALCELLAGRPVDWALTQGKQELAVRVAEETQAVADRYELGITIRSVDLGAVEPPPEVADAFDKVVSAQREREQAINQAHSYANRTTAQANGAAQQSLDEAHAYQNRRVRQAQGDAQRFESLLAEYQRSPSLTASRLYLDTMAGVLPKFRAKLIVDSGSPVDVSILREEKR